MARIGWFDPELDKDSWFDSELNKEAWFDSEMVEPPSGGVINHADNLSTGNYTYTGYELNDVKVGAAVNHADNLSTGTYTYTGISLNDLRARNDSLTTGNYSYTGNDLNDVLVGEVEPEIPAKQETGAGKSKRARPIIVEVDGKEYRVAQEYLSTFLAKIQSKVQQVVKAKSRNKVRFVRKAPAIVVKDAPLEFITQIQQDIDYTSEKIEALFNIAMRRYAQELDDEDALLMLL
jgi:hypothetical protein